jgi:hypothetical protein
MHIEFDHELADKYDLRDADEIWRAIDGWSISGILNKFFPRGEAQQAERLPK